MAGFGKVIYNWGRASRGRAIMDIDDNFDKSLEEWLHDDFDGAELNNILGTSLSKDTANSIALYYARHYKQEDSSNRKKQRALEVIGYILAQELDRLIKEWRE
jgi:hypothetical protein